MMRRRVGAVRIVTADDLIALRDQVQREMTNIDAAIAGCPALDAATLANWATSRSITQHWCDTVTAELGAVIPSGRNGELYDQGIGLEKVIRTNWWPRLQAAGCAVPYAQPTAPAEPLLSTDNPSGPLGWLGPLEGILKLIVGLMVWREVKDFIR